AGACPREKSKGKEFNDVILAAGDDGEAILGFASRRLPELSVVNAATAVHRLAKCQDSHRIGRDDRLTALFDRILDIFRLSGGDAQLKSQWKFHVDTRALTNVAWSQAKMLMKHPLLIRYISSQVLDCAAECSPQQLANCAWAFARIEHCDARLLAVLASQAARRIREFSPQNLMCMLWASARLQLSHAGLLGAAETFARDMQSFTAQHLSIVAWACATLGVRSALLDGIAVEAARKMRTFTAQNLANLVWAFAVLDVRHPKLFSAVSLEARKKLQEFHQQHLCNLAWAFSVVQQPDEELLLPVAEMVIERAPGFNPQGLSNMACAFAVLGLAHHRMFEVIAEVAVDKIHECSPHDLESLAWAFARLGVFKKDLMRHISQAAKSKVQDFHPLDFANIAWAFATLGEKDDELMETLAREAENKVSTFSSQALGNCAWAFSSLRCPGADLLLGAIADEARGRELDPQHLAALLDAKLCCDENGRRLGAVLWRFMEVFPQSEAQWQGEEYWSFLQKLQVDNFGRYGSKFLLQRMGIAKADRTFTAKALREVTGYIRENNTVLQGLTTQDVLHKRVCSFAEFSFVVQGRRCEGAMIRENGYWTKSAVRGGKARWLRAAHLKVGALVDRSLCSEFQLLEELCDHLEACGLSQGAESVEGLLQLFISTTPCVSCLGALGQFRQLLPAITMEVSFGQMPMRQGWQKDALHVG
ncbi:unnamed protein product, partial [Effrenium voratum]